jgi:hypothetical protein
MEQGRQEKITQQVRIGAQNIVLVPSRILVNMRCSFYYRTSRYIVFWIQTFFYTDPDPAFCIDTDPDPTFHLHTDQDPTIDVDLDPYCFKE